ncbi:MAG: radical SAM protein [Bdellovibrionales bacterium]|nr:radical SAM protein [Bdellovibrionales bacterium]
MKELCSPVKASRRFGTVVEVNPLGSGKLCSFDCIYCDLGPSEIRMNQIRKETDFPKVEDIDTAVRETLRSANTANENIDTIVISGNGEPTLYPDLPDLIDRLLAIRQEIVPQAKIVILTNGVHFDTNKLIAALNLLDERIIKLDCGNENAFKTTNRPLVRANISRVTSGGRKLKDCIAQSLFYGGPQGNDTKELIDEWLEVLGILQPKCVQIYTINRSPLVEDCRPLTEDELYTIQSLLKRKLSIESKVFT